jgi:hypothetical protein
MKVREAGRVISAVVLVATGVNADGHREVLGVKVATSETKAAWSTFFADLVARGLSGVRLVTSDAHAGLVEAIAANLPGAAWQRCRTHYAANLMSVCPKSAWPAVKAMLHSVYNQPDAASVHAQYDKSRVTPRPTMRGQCDASYSQFLILYESTSNFLTKTSNFLTKQSSIQGYQGRHPVATVRPVVVVLLEKPSDDDFRFEDRMEKLPVEKLITHDTADDAVPFEGRGVLISDPARFDTVSMSTCRVTGDGASIT